MENLTPSILTIRQLRKHFGHKVIFDGASLEIASPGVYGLVAPNGYGKTTLLNIIAGLTGFSGEVSIFGKPADQVSSRDFAYLQNNQVLYDYLTGYDHLLFLCKLHHLDKQKIHEMAVRFDMTDYLHKKTGKYSQGMKQRLLLAIALIKEPTFILMDEPLTGLDPTSTLILRETLLELAEQGTTMLISSHDLNELDKVTDQIFFIDDQQIQYSRINAEENQYIQLVVPMALADQALAVFEQTGVVVTARRENEFTLLKPEGEVDLLGLLTKNDIRVDSYQTRRTGSETLYKEKYFAKENGG